MIVEPTTGHDTFRADVCIVGAGPAGISLALRLAEHSDLRVCLVESGGLTYDYETQELARAEAVGAAYYPLHETRVRAIGGSSWSWGGICTPLDELSFEDRPWAEDARWPIRLAELEPYLDEAFEMCGITPGSYRREAERCVADGQAAGIDPSRIVATPVCFSRPVRFGVEYRSRLIEAQTIEVLVHTTVTGLEVEGERIVAARASSLGRAVRIEATAFVLAGGGIENARMLLIAGLGGPAVGRYFMEHPRVVNRYRVRRGSTPLGRLVGGGAAGTLRFRRLALSNELQRSERVLNHHVNVQFGYMGQLGPQWDAARRLAILATSPWNESPYFQDAGGGRMRLRSRDLRTVLCRPDRTAFAVLGAVTGWPALRRYLEVWTAVEQLPEEANRVELTETLDPLGMPRVRVHWQVGAAEERTYRYALGVLLQELEKVEPGISRASMDDADPWPLTIVGNWHHEGTTRMHTDPRRGVVDATCRVHGTSNLHVAGSSTFPASGSTSPTVTIVQLALRLADHLAQSLGRSVPVTTAIASDDGHATAGSTDPSALGDGWTALAVAPTSPDSDAGEPTVVRTTTELSPTTGAASTGAAPTTGAAPAD